jgi:hypothetical protein
MMSSSLSFAVVTCCALMLVLGCAAPKSRDARTNKYDMNDFDQYGPGYANPDKPEPETNATYHFSGCSHGTRDRLKERTFAAAFLALNECGWAIDSIDAVGGTITAHACRRFTPSDCARLMFWAKHSGELEAQNPPIEPVSLSVRHKLDDWMQRLRRSFDRYRCQNYEMLQTQLAKHGLRI